MLVTLNDIDVLHVNGLWRWQYGECCSDSGFESEAMAVKDAGMFVDRTNAAIAQALARADAFTAEHGELPTLQALFGKADSIDTSDANPLYRQ